MSKKVDYEIKLAFIGQSTVGKTSLITQYTKKTFADTYLSTIGADQIIKELNNREDKLIEETDKLFQNSFENQDS